MRKIPFGCHRAQWYECWLIDGKVLGSMGIGIRPSHTCTTLCLILLDTSLWIATLIKSVSLFVQVVESIKCYKNCLKFLSDESESGYDWGNSLEGCKCESNRLIKCEHKWTSVLSYVGYEHSTISTLWWEIVVTYHRCLLPQKK